MKVAYDVTPSQAQGVDFDPGISVDVDPDFETVSLPRHGERPLTFMAKELGVASSYVPRSPYWFQLTIYRRHEGGFVAAIKQYTKSAMDPGYDVCIDASSFADMMHGLETFDAGQVVRCMDDPGDGHLSAGELAVRTYHMRFRLEQARQQFRCIVAELLHELAQE
ncbi:MAG: hypothetical protein AAF677_04095 [Pseudomonadota bacterium]